MWERGKDLGKDGEVGEGDVVKDPESELERENLERV